MSKEPLGEGWESIETADAVESETRDKIVKDEVERQNEAASVNVPQPTTIKGSRVPLNMTGSIKTVAPAVSKSIASAEITTYSTGSPSLLSQPPFTCRCNTLTNKPCSKAGEDLTQERTPALKQNEINNPVDSSRVDPSGETFLLSTKGISSMESTICSPAGKSQPLRYEVKTGHRRSWKPENQTYPQGILKNPTPTSSSYKSSSDSVESLAQTAPPSISVTSMANACLKPAGESHLREEARNLHYELVRDYSRSAELNQMMDYILNNPETSDWTIQNLITLLQANKRCIDWADYLVAKMGLKPSFSPLCRKWQDRSWQAWKEAAFLTTDGSPRFERIRGMVDSAELFDAPKHRLFGYFLKPREFVVAALWDTRMPYEWIKNKIELVQYEV